MSQQLQGCPPWMCTVLAKCKLFTAVLPAEHPWLMCGHAACKLWAFQCDPFTVKEPTW